MWSGAWVGDWPGSWEGSEAAPGAMSAVLSGGGSLTGTLDAKATAPETIFWGWWRRRKKAVEEVAPEVVEAIEEVAQPVKVEESAGDKAKRAQRKAEEIALLAEAIRKAQARERALQAQRAAAEAKARLDALLEAEFELRQLLDLAQAEWERAKRDMEEADIAFLMAVLAEN